MRTFYRREKRVHFFSSHRLPSLAEMLPPPRRHRDPIIHLGKCQPTFQLGIWWLHHKNSACYEQSLAVRWEPNWRQCFLTYPEDLFEVQNRMPLPNPWFLLFPLVPIPWSSAHYSFSEWPVVNIYIANSTQVAATFEMTKPTLLLLLRHSDKSSIAQYEHLIGDKVQPTRCKIAVSGVRMCVQPH